MESSGFFNSQEVNGAQDRVYYAKDFANLFTHFISNGVYAQASDQLKVIPNASPNMNIYIKPGFGFINGYWYMNNEDKELNIQANTTNADMFACVIMKLDMTSRSITMYVKYKTNSPPDVQFLQRDDIAYELLLSYISIKPGQITINEPNIYDTRSDSNVCGMIVNPIEHLDTSEIYSQFQAQANYQIEKFSKDSQKQLDDLQSAVSSILAGTDSMLKTEYDKDKDGIVDDSERLGGQLPNYYKDSFYFIEGHNGITIAVLEFPSKDFVMFVHSQMENYATMQPGEKYQIAVDLNMNFTLNSIAHYKEVCWAGDAAQTYAAAFCTTDLVDFSSGSSVVKRLTQKFELGEGLSYLEGKPPHFSNIIIGRIL